MSCGRGCPDYCVVQSVKPVVQKQKKSGFEVSFKRTRRASETSTIDTTQKVPRNSISVSAEQSAGGKRLISIAAIAVVAIVLSVGLGMAYLDYKASKEYSKAYLKSLYVMKVGSDLSLGIVDDISTRWSPDNGNTFNPVPIVLEKDLARLNKVKERLSLAMQEIPETPDDFTNVETQLRNLNGVFLKMCDLATDRPQSYQALKSSRVQLENDFNRTVGKIKGSMPNILREEALVAMNKFRELKFLE